MVNESRNKTYERLAKLASEVGIDEKKIYSLLEISNKPDADGGLNSGNKVTDDIKLLVKVGHGRNVRDNVLTSRRPIDSQASM